LHPSSGSLPSGKRPRFQPARLSPRRWRRCVLFGVAVSFRRTSLPLATTRRTRRRSPSVAPRARGPYGGRMTDPKASRLVVAVRARKASRHALGTRWPTGMLRRSLARRVNVRPSPLNPSQKRIQPPTSPPHEIMGTYGSIARNPQVALFCWLGFAKSSLLSHHFGDVSPGPRGRKAN
jgi:hypothetical protein